jgi:hypothetical protein
MRLFRRRRVSDDGAGSGDKDIDRLVDIALPPMLGHVEERAGLGLRMDEALHPHGDPSARDAQYTGD